MQVRLLCTFVHRSDVKLVADLLFRIFDIRSNRIFVYCNEDDSNSFYLTYSANLENQRFAKNTISIHRNSNTNTYYTVNAMNSIISICNNGVLDKTFQLDWYLYEDMLILTNNDAINKIKIKHIKIIQREM